MTATESPASTKVLQLCSHRRQYRGHSGTTEKDLIVDFLFSMQESGGKPRTFWTEVRLKQSLRSQGEWATLSDEHTMRAMYAFAVDAIRQAGGREIRSVTMGWKAQAPYANGPCWDLSRINLRSPGPETIEGEGVRHVVVEQH